MESKFDDENLEILSKAFRSCDIDGSGTISKNELIQICKRSAHDIKAGHLNFIFSCIDKDKSGDIDYEEFLRFIYVCQFETTDLEQAKMMFDGFDKDGGGTIDKKELFQAICQLGIKVAKEDIDLAFKVLDKNNDGYLDFSEFLQLFNMLKGSLKSR